MFCIYSPLFVAVLEGLNIARGGNIERITTKKKKKKKKQLSPRKSRIHYSPSECMCIHLHIRDCASCLCTNTDLHDSFAIPVISADNPPDTPVSLHIIWTFASNFYFLTKHGQRLSYAWLIPPFRNAFYVLITCGVVFFSPSWSVICRVIDSSVQYCRSWFILDLLYTQKRSDWGRFPPLGGWLNTAEKKSLPSHIVSSTWSTANK